MSFRTIILGTVVAVAALAAGPAMADFNGTLDGSYGNMSADHGSGSASDWSVNGAGDFGLGWGGLNAQINGGYSDLSANHGGGSVNDWNVGGSLFWLGSMGRVGANLDYTTLDVSGGGGNGHLTNYGGFAEWYAGHMFTLGAKGGGLSASGGGGNGSYLGGEGIIYPMHDLAVNGTIDYLSFGGGHLTNYTGSAEWMVSESVPVSVWGGYTRTEVAGSGANTWFVGLRFYTNGNGAQTLEDRQRSGTVGWAAQLTPIFNF